MLWRRALMISTISPGAARFMPSTYMPATRKPRAHDRDRDFCVLAVWGEKAAPLTVRTGKAGRGFG